MLKKFLFTIVCALLAAVSLNAQSTQKNTEVLMVLPFENTSQKAEFNWIGESFAESLAELLSGRWQQPVVNGKANIKDNLFGFSVISNDERKIKQQQQNIPLTSLPSLATSLRFAMKLGVTKLILGKFKIYSEKVDDKDVSIIEADVNIIDVRQGSFDYDKNDKGEAIINDKGQKIYRKIVINKVLTDLQSLEGEIANQILLRQKVLSVISSEIIAAANKVPARAFEAYIKGLLTSETDVQTRENFLKNAMRIYADDEKTKGGIYADAALELGHLFLNQKKFPEAVTYFSQVPQTSGQYAEAAFYTGLIYWQQQNYEQALAVLRPLAEDLKLTSVYNTLGAITVQASRAEKKNKGNADKLLLEGLDFLKRAAESSPDEAKVRFNYGFALFLSGKFAEATEQFLAIAEKNQKDGEIYFLLAKAFEKTGDAQKATDADDKARRFLLTKPNDYAKLATDWQSGKTDGINLRVEQPARKDFVSIIFKKQPATVQKTQSDADALLVQAQTFYKNNNDDEAMAVIRKILVSEPMSAQAYLLLGMIHLRRGDLEQATSSLKTALFWDSSLIEAHVMLGRIYVQKGDCQLGQTYAASAAAIDAENADVAALKRQVERCSTK